MNYRCNFVSGNNEMNDIEVGNIKTYTEWGTSKHTQKIKIK